jgi:hypothetical protein
VTTLAAGPTSQRHFVSRALVRFCSRVQSRFWGLKLTRAYGIGIGVSYAIVVWLGREAPSFAAGARLWSRAISVASWVVGVGALSLAANLAARDDAQGVSGLARLRGFSDAELERARTVSGALRLAWGALLPGLIVALALALRVRSWSATLGALGLACFTLIYAALLGATLSPLARSCQRWLPERGRTLFLGIVLGPWLLGEGLGARVPSIPAAFGWLLEHFTRSLG